MVGLDKTRGYRRVTRGELVMSRKRLILVGGGHAHIYSLKYADRFIAEGAEAILIGPDRFHYYSGMGPGMLSRIYEPEQVRFNVQAIIESRGGTFIRGKAASIDAKNRTLLLESGETVDYDVISCNVGSHVPLHLIPGAEGLAFPVKPIDQLERVRETIIEKIKKGVPNILLIGGGPAGVEMAGNIWRLVRANKGNAQIILANSTDRLLPTVAARAGRLAEQSLSGRGIRIISNFMAASMDERAVYSKSGDTILYDVAILTIGIVPPHIFIDSGLKTSPDGGLLVNDCLQSVDHPEIFGGGDCIAIQGRSLGRVGVYAVREAPILFNNLVARLTGKSLKTFRPQKRYLLIFNLGDGTGIFVRGPFVWKGKLAFRLKNYIDMSFMSKFQAA
jgi:NADH dehydrogenase FAD-containing subunit